MNRVFVDTAAWLALLNTDDVWHQKAHSVRLDLVRSGYTFITTDFVLLEVADALCAPKHRKRTADFLSNIYHLESTQVIALSQDLLRQGLRLYAERQDKD